METTTKKDDLHEILRLHGMWLRREAGGARANLRNRELPWLELIGYDLRGADFTGADLCRADLRGCNLIGATFRGADLRRADLRGCNLIGATLRGADLQGADLSACNLSGVDLRWVDLSDILIQAGPIGSRDDYIVYNATLDELRAGCWIGTLREFEARVEAVHGDTVHGREYGALIEYIKTIIRLR